MGEITIDDRCRVYKVDHDDDCHHYNNIYAITCGCAVHSEPHLYAVSSAYGKGQSKNNSIPISILMN